MSINGRLSVAAALSKNAALESLSSETKSASMSKAEKDIKALKIENSKLRQELEDVRSLYQQLVGENSHERFEERRVTLLKSQIIQLERQILLMSEALSSRSETLMEVENALISLLDKCRFYIQMNVPGPEVNVARADLTRMVETAESARLKLYKNIENTTNEKLARPLIFFNEFIQPKAQREVTLLDVAMGQLEHLNLKHVSKLETKLSMLYRELVCLHELLSDDGQQNRYHLSSSHLAMAVKDRHDTQLLKACAMCSDCASDLLDLSLLFPAAPWPPLKKAALKEVSIERVLKCLPGVTKSKGGETRKVISALVKAYNYKNHLMSNQVSVLKDELKFHKTVYNLQIQYTKSLFEAIKEGYSRFEESTNETIVRPLKDILEVYMQLNSSASEEALRDFLTKFKDNAVQLQDIVDNLGFPANSKEGCSLLSSYGEEFFRSLDNLVYECQTRRDKEAERMEELKTQHSQLVKELQDLLEEQESKQHEPNKATSVEDVSMSSVTSRKKLPPCQEPTNKTSTSTPSVDNTVHFKCQENYQRHDRENSNDILSKMSSLSLSPPESVSRLNDPIKAKEAIQTENTELGSNVAASNKGTPTAKDMSEITDIGAPKPQKKLNYVPNTFVPKRTLRLQRSGSLSKLAVETNLSTASDHLEDNLSSSSAKHFNTTNAQRQEKISSKETTRNTTSSARSGERDVKTHIKRQPFK
ncbi:hypothetical protein ACJMK2_044043 [Sinanodonta woodiana]|uniref:Uncharacterized protein n=1 Tax=Sinanodonta woodiana TaxID=1069815 RepID=A0ABD3W1Y5_SINWO